MDFNLTDEHRQVQKLARDFAEKEIAPIIKEADRKQEMPDFILPRLGELGLLGLCIPVKYGGQGMDYITLGLVCEELDYVDIALRTALSVHVGLNSLGLLQWGTEEQKQRFLAAQARGEKYAMFGLTEPGAGSDVAGMASTARLEGDEYVINGEKMWISLAAQAHHILWFAKTDPEVGSCGISAFLIETDRPGVTAANVRGKLGSRAGSTGWVNCQDVRVPVSHRIGKEGEGFKIAMSCLDNGRYTVGAGCVGAMRAALDASVKYARERKAFGREIGKFQLVQQKIARMTRDHEIGRLMYLKVGWMKNQGLRNTRETSLLKWSASEAAFRAANEAIQVHGAYGYSDEYDVERFMRNVRVTTIYEGTSEVHQLMQAGYALGYRKDGELRCELPPYDKQEWQAEN
ncbi:MAG: acyl-CoA dehydrogenase family protein [Anaerolineales bacterium]|jgi:glutaryl-CoA dehydrogenase (non-decarboxylating)|nr:acyl-CoA dehydrogenase family protein [Anaerolineales bacterium]HJO33364.1 acyl-CoA dehydrogenase family protein [Anaerolineales bacterium]